MSVSILSLWLPILLGGLFCWMTSAIFHMFVKHHNADYKPLNNEDEVMSAIGKGEHKPGLYTMPHCVDMNAMNNEGMQNKFKQGPVAMLSVFDNGLPPLGKMLSQQILFFTIGCVLIAYAASFSLPAGAEFMTVFRQVIVVGFMAFGWGLIPYSIWYGLP